MDESIIISPLNITFVVTNKCTSSCKDCCFSCNQKNKDRLTLSEMKDYLDQSISKYSSIRALIITGGECFTIGKDLISIIKYATKKKLSTRIITNAFWAKTFKQAYKKLLPLSIAGLKEINFSTGDEHQKWVASDNIIYATVASIKLNFRVAINVEKQNYTQFSSLNLTEDPRLKKYINNASGQSLTIVESIWMPFTKSTKKKTHTNCIWYGVSKYSDCFM